MEKKRVFGTGGELLVHQLVAQGVPYAFTNTGSAEAGFFNALLTVPGVQPILLLAESLVLSAADGYAKASRKPAFVNVHLAAGTRQGSGQLQNAYFDGTPMVVTAAMRDVGSYGDHGALVASGGFSQMGTVEDITKRRWEVWDAAGIPTVTRRAFKDAMTFPTGPVYVAYASSALEATNVEGLIQAADAAAHGPGAGCERHPRDLGRAAQRREALLVCGPDIAAAGAEDEIATLAERLGLPVATGIFDYGSFPVHHPNYAGAVETLSEDGYDVVCCVGYRQNTRGNATDLRFASAGTIIGIGHDPAQLGNTYAARHRRVGQCAAHAVRAERRVEGRGRPAAAPASAGARSVRARGEQRNRKLHDEAMALATRQADPPQLPGARGGRGVAREHDDRVRELPQCRPPDAVRPRQESVAARPELRRLARVRHRRSGRRAARRAGPPVRLQPRRRRRDVQRLGLLDHGALRPADPDHRVEQPELPDGAHQLPHVRRRDGEAEEVPRGLPRRAGDRLRDAREGAGHPGREVREPKDLKAALRRGVDAITAGEPYVLDVRVATVGTGAESTWHQRFKLRG